MFRYQILIEYVGTGFIGWQSQQNGKSVQKTIEKSLKKILNLHVIQKLIYGVAAVSPPSTIISVPVIYLASSEHKNKTA